MKLYCYTQIFYDKIQGENHDDNAKVTLFNNEFFINRQNGQQAERISDSNFAIEQLRYHIECQSTRDGTILIRILKELAKIYNDIIFRLEESVTRGIITEYTKITIIDMSKKVLNQIAAKYANIKEGIGKIMGGKILNHRAKDLVNKGKREQLLELIQKKLVKGKSIAEIADALEESEAYIEELIKEL